MPSFLSLSGRPRPLPRICNLGAARQGLDGVLAVTAERLYFCPIDRRNSRASGSRAPCGPDGPKAILLEEVESPRRETDFLPSVRVRIFRRPRHKLCLHSSSGQFLLSSPVDFQCPFLFCSVSLLLSLLLLPLPATPWGHSHGL